LHKGNQDENCHCQRSIYRKMPLLTSKLNIELKKKMEHCFIWLREIWTLRKLERKYLESFEVRCWRRIEKITWLEKVTNEQVLDHIGEKRTLINNILCRKANWIGHILRNKLPPS